MEKEEQPKAYGENVGAHEVRTIEGSAMVRGHVAVPPDANAALVDRFEIFDSKSDACEA